MKAMPGVSRGSVLTVYETMKPGPVCMEAEGLSKGGGSGPTGLRRLN